MTTAFLEAISKQAGKQIQPHSLITCVNPKHLDKTPSMKVYEDHAYCFGCRYYFSAKKKQKKSLKSFVRERFINLCAQEDISEFCKKRGYKVDMLKGLRVGLCTYDVMNTLQQEFTGEQLRRTGLVKDRHFTYQNRIIIPYGDDYFSARATSPSAKVKNLFLAGEPKKPFIIAGREVTILCEGETDAIALKHIYPDFEIIGIGGCTSLERVLSQRSLHGNVWICFDNDEAGRKASFEAVKLLHQDKCKVNELTFDARFKDIDELHKEFQEKSEEYISVVEVQKKQIFIEQDFKPISKENYKAIIVENFPDMWEIVDACISVVCVIKLKEWNDPVGVNLIGPPSSEKTTVLSFLYEIKDLIYKSDNFTPKCFVTHAANISQEDLEKIDLLPKIKDKTIIVPELAPIFGKRKDDLIENIGVITRIFDGEGYESDSGMRGHRGYTGEYLFTWLGASTPLERRVWKVMGRMGARWFFLHVPDKKNVEQALHNIVCGTTSYGEKVKKCAKATRRFIKSIFQDGQKRNISWNNKNNDPKAAEVITACSKLLSRLRAEIQIWDEGEGNFQYQMPLIEEPFRIASVLTNIAKGHAISEGRNTIMLADVPILVRIVFSSMPENRRVLLKVITKNIDKPYFTSDFVSEQLNCSNKHSLAVLHTLKALGILEREEQLIDTGSQGGRPQLQFKLKDDIKQTIKLLIGFLPGYDSVASQNRDESKLPKNDSVKSNAVIDSGNKSIDNKSSFSTPSKMGKKPMDVLREIIIEKRDPTTKQVSIETLEAALSDKLKEDFEEFLARMRGYGVIFEPKPGFLGLLE